jgi:hypothetical protein
MRAQGKLVHASLVDEGEADLPLHDSRHELSCLVAIEQYQKMSEPLRRRAREQGANCSELLFLHPQGTSVNGGKVISNVGQGFAGEYWPAFLKRHISDPVIGGLPITRSMIRQTVILLRGGRSDFSTAPAQALAEHKKAGTTATYLDANFMRRQLDEQIRVFMELFEAVLAQGVPNALKLTQTDHDTFNERRLTAMECGLDFACVALVPDTEPARSYGPTCTPLQPCDKCPVRRFVPNHENLLTLHLAHRALVEAEGDFSGSNPARWVKIWLPWRALTEAYVAKLKASPHAVNYRRIVQSADAMVASGRLSLPIVR